MSESLNNFGGFTFEEWAQLFKDNPEEFERCRIQALETFIENADPENRDRLQRLLSAFDTAVEGKSTEERLQIATTMLEGRVFELASAATLFSKTVDDVLQRKT